MKTLKKFVAYIIGVLFAYFFPELGTEGVWEAFASFTAFAPLVVLLSAELNTWLKWEDGKALASTGGISLGLAYIGYFFNIGIMEDVPSWHPAIYGVGAWAVAALGFAIPLVKTLLQMLFNYEFKRRK